MHKRPILHVKRALVAFQSLLNNIVKIERTASDRIENRFPDSIRVVSSHAFLDFDDFGDINKKHGEPFGDVVLLKVIHSLVASMRPDDVIARYGGDEIIIIWAQRGKVLGDRLRAMFNTFAELVFETEEHQEIGISFSAGVVDKIPAEKIADCVKKAADLKNQAKKAGKSRVYVNQPED